VEKEFHIVGAECRLQNLNVIHPKDEGIVTVSVRFKQLGILSYDKKGFKLEPRMIRVDFFLSSQDGEWRILDCSEQLLFFYGGAVAQLKSLAAGKDGFAERWSGDLRALEKAHLDAVR